MQRNSHVSNDISVSFHSWLDLEYNFIKKSIIERALEFLQEKSGSNVDNLILDSRWHYLDKDKKHGYRGGEGVDNNGVPNLTLTYNSFKHGGYSENFSSYKVIKELWQQKRDGLIVYPKTFKKKILIQTDSLLSTANKFISTSWDQLSDKGLSDYLSRKQLSSIKGIRFSKDFIAVKLINCKEECFGLQKIYNNGKKLFTKGTVKKGNFVVIGSTNLPTKINTINICEGIATAGSIHMATLEPVFAALDAANIINVVPILKKHYPKANILIWADNDQWKSEQIHNGQKLGNTGLIKANLAALNARNAKVIYPDFSDLNLDNYPIKPTDFNDLHILKGLNAITASIAENPDINMALTKKITQAHKLHHGFLSKNNFDNSTKFIYNEQYLPNNIDICEGINLIRSPIGTGKTNVVENYLKSNPKLSIIFTTHLISLVENAAQRLDLKSYNQCDAFDLQMQRKIAICLNSLGKLTLEGPLPEYDLLVIDEIEQVLTRLCSNIECKPLVFEVLKKLISNCKTVICLDADLSITTVDLIKTWCSNRAINIHFNEYKVGQDREIILYDDRESLQLTAIKNLNINKHIYLAFNSRNEARKTFDLISNMCPQKKGLFISSTNNGDEDVIKFFNDVNNESKKYDYIVCTPSVSTGVSISNDHFTFVGGIFHSDINTPNDCMQALGRIRNTESIHVFCDKRMGYKTLEPKLIASKWTETHKYDLNLMGLDDLGDRVIINNDYEKLCINVTLNKNRGSNNFYYEFCLLAASNGYKFTYSEFQLEKVQRKEIKVLKNYFHEISLQNNIINACPIDINTAKLIEQKSRRTLQDTLNYDKHKIIEFYKLNPYDEKEIQQYTIIDKQGQLKKQIMNLELALSDSAASKRLFEKQYENSEQFAADLEHFALKQQLYSRLIQELRIIKYDNHLNYDSYLYTKKTILQSDFIDWVLTNHKILHGIMTIPSIESIRTQPLIFVSRLLSKLGIKQKRTGKSKNGCYSIDVDSLRLMAEIINRRGLVKGNTCKDYIINTTTCVSDTIVPKSINHHRNSDYLNITCRSNSKISQNKRDLIEFRVVSFTTNLENLCN